MKVKRYRVGSLQIDIQNGVIHAKYFTSKVVYFQQLVNR
jgi:hypothetical protein